MEKFLRVDKAMLSNKQLTLLDKLIIAQIAEYTRNKKQCYMTDKQFADAFGVSVQQVTRAIKRLSDNGLVIRTTNTVSNNGQSSKIRTLKAIVTSDYSSDKGIVKNDKRYSQNDTEGIVTSDYIKDNLKDNKKDNLEDAKAEKRELEDLSDKELEDLSKDYQQHMSYKDIAKKYHLTKVTKAMCESIDGLLQAKAAERQKAELAKQAELAPVYSQLATYLGQPVSHVPGCVRSLQVDAITLLHFAEGHPQYSYAYYRDNDCANGYHRVDNVGDIEPNVTYAAYLRSGLNS